MNDHSNLATTRGRVATIEITRGPNNYMDVSLLGEIVAALRSLEEEGECRAVVLCSEGKHFCAGVNFNDSAPRPGAGERAPHLYDMAQLLFEQPLPIIAAVQGAAIGGGLGLAMAADFRVGSLESRFSANFVQLGFHHGFALTVTLPRVIGQQAALRMLYTGARVSGDEAARIGLIDTLVPATDLRSAAYGLAEVIASSAPLAVRSVRTTMRRGIVGEVRDALLHEKTEQARLARTEDWKEGLQAAAERRPPSFVGR